MSGYKNDSQYQQARARVVELSRLGWRPKKILEEGNTGLRPGQISGIIDKDRYDRGVAAQRKRPGMAPLSGKPKAPSTSTKQERLAAKERMMRVIRAGPFAGLSREDRLMFERIYEQAARQK